jgi:hypothetical protein
VRHLKGAFRLTINFDKLSPMISFKKLPFIVLTTLFLLVTGLTFSQTKKSKKTVKPISKVQGDTTKPSGFYSAQVYFQGNGLPYPKVFTCYGADLNLLMKNIDSASNGADVIFDHLNFITAKGATIPVKEIPYNFNRQKDKVQFKSKAVQQADELRSYKFISGTIYFSGFGHPNVSTAKASDTATLNKYYAISGPGTTITLDNCVYKNTNGSLVTISKSVKLE